MTTVAQHVQRAREVLARRYGGLTLLTEGRNGLVFSGHDTAHGDRPVVLKVAFPTDGEEHTGPEVFFHRESEIGAMLSHPHILRTTPAQSVDGIEFYEMDAAGPHRLEHLVSATKPPSFERVIVIMRELAAALDFAHARGIVHGGLRPSIVHLDMNGHVLVEGFLLRESEASTDTSPSPAAAGDAAYMAPEQWRDQRIDRRADVYSAGIIAYELLTGEARVGYTSGSVPEIRPIELAPNRPLRVGVPLHVNAAIRRATNRDPALRFDSAGEFVQALEQPDRVLGHSLPTFVPAMEKERRSIWMLVALVLGIGVLTLFALPSEPRRVVLGWGLSLYSWALNVNRIDWNSDRSGRTVVGGETRRGAGPTSGPSRGARSSPSRDTAQAGDSSVRRDSTNRVDGSRRAVSPAQRPLTGAEGQSRGAGDARGDALQMSTDPTNAAARARQTGVLKISVDQGRALVFVNGVRRGYAPLVMTLKPAPYRVSVRGSLAYEPREIRVSVVAADTAFAEFYATNAVPPDTSFEAAHRFSREPHP